MCMIVKIDKLSHDMRGITKIDNKITFIDKVLPDEVVNIKLTKERKKFNEGKVLSLIDESDDRIVCKCPYYDSCGGCNTMHIKYEKSLIYKKNNVKDIMKRYCNIDVEMDIVGSCDIYNYRNKITMKVSNNKLSLVGESLVNIDYCYLVNDNINSVIKLLNGTDLINVKEVIIKGTNDIMVIIKGDISKDTFDKLKNNVNSIVLNDNIIYGNDYINIDISDYKYIMYPDSFFQVNTSMISKLYDKVLEYAGSGNRILDLYCGAGTIGIYLAKNFKYVKGVEQNESAVKSANLNKKINNIGNISFECKRASDIIIDNYDVVVVDPPRHGLDKITLEKLILSKAKKIVYVSCNPITLARDINLLNKDYEFVDGTLFDMFPCTGHIECVSLLQKKNL